jgi:hypothetical protein
VANVEPIEDVVKRISVVIVIALVIGAAVLTLAGLCINAFGTQDTDSTVFWRCTTFTLFVLVVGVCLEWGEKTIRIAGLVFQAVVIVVAVITINGVRTTLDLPGVLPTLAATAERPFKSNAGAPVGEGALLEGSEGYASVGIGTLTVHHNNLSTEDRFNALEDQLARVEAMAGRDALLLKVAIRDTQDDVAHRDQAQADARKALKDLVVELLTGGLPLAFFGLVWLFIGAVLSSLPNEVATWITRFRFWCGSAFAKAVQRPGGLEREQG